MQQDNNNQIPETNQSRVIIPLKGFIPKYDLRNFHPRQLDDRVAYEQIERVINDVCAPLTSCQSLTKKVLGCLSGPLFVSIIIIVLAIGGIDLGIWNFVILVASVVVCALLIFLSLRNFKMNYRSVNNVILKYREQFHIKGLRWEVPKHCLWLELWKDYNQINAHPELNSLTGTDLVDVEVRTVGSERDFQNVDIPIDPNISPLRENNQQQILPQINLGNSTGVS